MSSTKEILVYAHWVGIAEPLLMGVLTVIPSRGKEVFSFEYSKEWLDADCYVEKYSANMWK